MRFQENILIVSTIQKLRALARLSKYSKSQRDEAKEYMIELRKHGFTNRDINVIIEDRWKIPTIKKFTRGTKVLSTARAILHPKETQFRILKIIDIIRQL